MVFLGKSVSVITKKEGAIDRDIAGRTLDRYHDIDGCNEYKRWSDRRKR